MAANDRERQLYKKIFDDFDVNHDNHISSSELKNVLTKLGQNPSQDEIDNFIKETDTDKNGTIEFGEFCRYLSHTRRAIFNDIDVDGNGYITPNELKVAFAKLGVEITLEEAVEAVKKYDTDHDGRMNYVEFVVYMQQRLIVT